MQKTGESFALKSDCYESFGSFSKDKKSLKHMMMAFYHKNPEEADHKEIPITYGYTQDPFRNRSQNFKPKIKENYPQYLERENKNCFICGDSSHYARDCEKRFKPKESNDHIHNRINVNTLKVESEKQNSNEFANLQYVNIFVENQPVTALINSGCQIPVLNSSLIRVQTHFEEIITLSSCFGEQRMVEVKPINIFLNQLSPGLSVRTAISPTLTEEFIIHPSVYAEIKKLGHAKSDVLLSESGSSLGVHFNSNVSFSNVIENSSYDLPHVKNFNTRNYLSSLVKDYKCNKIKSTKLKLSIIREKCSDIVLCKKVNGAMKTSSVNFNAPSPMKNSPLVSMKKEKRDVPLQTAYSQAGRCGMQPKAKHSLRAQAQLMRTETVENFELVKVEPKLLREKRENGRGARAGETATHIGIREAEDWFRPIDLAKECDIIFHLEADHKEILLLMDILKTPLEIDHKTLNQRLKRTIPKILKEKIKIAIYAVIHHYARDCEKRFKPKESNDHIHNRINVNTLKSSEKQK
ncbi:hypothetical protein TNCV_591771 [Trichonephila clavipes]|nr:hypothetical protein TNCV_591771 [Trichonephila clavipes]